MGSPSKPGSSNEAGSESPGILPHNVPAGGGQAALANLGNFMSWVKHNTLSVFQAPKRVLTVEEIDLREVGGQDECIRLSSFLTLLCDNSLLLLCSQRSFFRI